MATMFSVPPSRSADSCARSMTTSQLKLTRPMRTPATHRPDVRLSGDSIYQGNQGLFPDNEPIFLVCCLFLNDVFPFAPPKGKWSDGSPMASVDWQAYASF